MKRKLLVLLLFCPLLLRAQAYFQQHVDTKLEVRLDDQKHFLHGFVQLSYTNNAPDTLHFLYLHLWPNAYSSDKTRFAEQQVLNRNTAFYFSKPSEKGYIDSLEFKINGNSVAYYSSDEYPDIARIDLPEPLLPGGKLELETPFRVKVPGTFSRMGHNRQAYYISQWFPKPAVYDPKGWHPLPYSDQGEFFSEIGSYDVEITVPRNYVVMATGNCLNEEENAWLDSLSQLSLPDADRPGTGVKAWRDDINSFPKSDPAWKTLRFKEDNIHDFAWFADKRFLVRKDTVTIPQGDGKAPNQVTIYTAFLPAEATYWQKGTEYIRKTLLAYSEAIGPYPYKTCKAVEGDLKAGGGMEYPTITLVDRLATRSSVIEVLVHEVGHNWFYGMLASNERDHAWMDEGFNTFYEQKVTAGIRVEMERREKVANKIENGLYYNAVSTRTDQSLANVSAAFTKENYGLDNYYKTALMLRWLEDYLGPDTFKVAMHEYFRRWQFRHPYPDDLRAVFTSVTSRPVDWFFSGALRTEKGVDFALRNAHTKDGQTRVTVRNKSDFAAPVKVSARLGDSVLQSVWSLPFSGRTDLSLTATEARSWTIGSEIPDYFTQNNQYRKRGLLRHGSPKLRFGMGLGRREAAEIYVLPAIAGNDYDGIMAGLLFHNLTVPQNRLRYTIAPLYSTRTRSFTGAASVGYWFFPGHAFKEIVPQIDVKTFHYDNTDLNISNLLSARYLKIAPSLTFVFRNTSALSPVTRSLMLKGYSIQEEGFDFTLDKTDSLYKPSLAASQQSTYGLLRYTHKNARTFNPFSYTAEAQLGKTFAKLSLEGNLRIDYHLPGKALYLRGYFGKFITTSGSADDNYRYWLTMTYTGANDYLYDGSYFGRSAREGLSSRQVSIQEGGQKLPTPLYGFPLGRSDDWLAGINLKSDLPFGKLPVRLFLDAGTYADAAKVNPSGNRFLYTAGIEVHALRDILLLHIPLLLCPDYKDYLKSIYPDAKFSNSISVSVQLQQINWLRTASSGLRYYLF